MKVMQVMAGAEFGGAEAFFVRLAMALHRAGLDQSVMIRHHASRAALLRSEGIDPITELRFGGALDIFTPMAIKREIRRFQPNVVMSWMNRAARMVPLGRGGADPFVHVARLGGYYDLKYYRNCDHLIGNTEDIVDYLVREGWPAERAHYLPNFVSSERVEAVARKAHSTPPGAPLILALGRLHTNKAFDVLVEALARVPDAYLWLAGDGPEREALENLARDKGVKPRVRFLGWRDDTQALLAACDVFVCPSRHEPLGNVVLEAWAQGKPVVAADSLGPGTLIRQMETGVLAPIDDAPALASALHAVLRDREFAARLGQAGEVEFQARFTEDAVVAQYLDFFDKVAG